MVNHNNDPGCRQMSVLNLAGFLPRSAVNGPGTRAVLWVQGCPRRCPGCFNPQFQPFSPATITDIRTLTGQILAVPGIEGVTFSGGEPFSQAGPLALLGEEIRRAGLSIVTYTGYTADELAEGTDPAWPALLAVTDLLVAGPYVASLSCPDTLTGSANQQVIPLGTRLTRPNDKNHCSSALTEFTISPGGSVTTSGFPSPDTLARLSQRCGGA